ncbi:hypothetical protein AB0F11_38120, partial [Streptomyces sp. NPDC032472]|uniref:hypothetical protein n=1 Tax=Streptomyces sp. NPDC032472 TaxID=3155018 RepID=UPI003402D7ED
VVTAADPEGPLAAALLRALSRAGARAEVRHDPGLSPGLAVATAGTPPVAVAVAHTADGGFVTSPAPPARAHADAAAVAASIAASRAATGAVAASAGLSSGVASDAGQGAVVGATAVPAGPQAPGGPWPPDATTAVRAGAGTRGGASHDAGLPPGQPVAATGTPPAVEAVVHTVYGDLITAADAPEQDHAHTTGVAASIAASRAATAAEPPNAPSGTRRTAGVGPTALPGGSGSGAPAGPGVPDGTAVVRARAGAPAEACRGSGLLPGRGVAVAGTPQAAVTAGAPEQNRAHIAAGAAASIAESPAAPATGPSQARSAARWSTAADAAPPVATVPGGLGAPGGPGVPDMAAVVHTRTGTSPGGTPAVARAHTPNGGLVTALGAPEQARADAVDAAAVPDGAGAPAMSAALTALLAGAAAQRLLCAVAGLPDPAEPEEDPRLLPGLPAVLVAEARPPHASYHPWVTGPADPAGPPAPPAADLAGALRRIGALGDPYLGVLDAPLPGGLPQLPAALAACRTPAGPLVAGAPRADLARFSAACRAAELHLADGMSGPVAVGAGPAHALGRALRRAALAAEERSGPGGGLLDEEWLGHPQARHWWTVLTRHLGRPARMTVRRLGAEGPYLAVVRESAPRRGARRTAGVAARAVEATPADAA